MHAPSKHEQIIQELLQILNLKYNNYDQNGKQDLRNYALLTTALDRIKNFSEYPTLNVPLFTRCIPGIFRPLTTLINETDTSVSLKIFNVLHNVLNFAPHVLTPDVIATETSKLALETLRFISRQRNNLLFEAKTLLQSACDLAKEKAFIAFDTDEHKKLCANLVEQRYLDNLLDHPQFINIPTIMGCITVITEQAKAAKISALKGLATAVESGSTTFLIEMRLTEIINSRYHYEKDKSIYPDGDVFLAYCSFPENMDAIAKLIQTDRCIEKVTSLLDILVSQIHQRELSHNKNKTTIRIDAIVVELLQFIDRNEKKVELDKVETTLINIFRYLGPELFNQTKILKIIKSLIKKNKLQIFINNYNFDKIKKMMEENNKIIIELLAKIERASRDPERLHQFFNPLTIVRLIEAIECQQELSKGAMISLKILLTYDSPQKKFFTEPIFPELMESLFQYLLKEEDLSCIQLAEDLLIITFRINPDLFKDLKTQTTIKQLGGKLENLLKMMVEKEREIKISELKALAVEVGSANTPKIELQLRQFENSRYRVEKDSLIYVDGDVFLSYCNPENIEALVQLLKKGQFVENVIAILQILLVNKKKYVDRYKTVKLDAFVEVLLSLIQNEKMQGIVQQIEEILIRISSLDSSLFSQERSLELIIELQKNRKLQFFSKHVDCQVIQKMLEEQKKKTTLKFLLEIKTASKQQARLADLTTPAIFKQLMHLIDWRQDFSVEAIDILNTIIILMTRAPYQKEITDLLPQLITKLFYYLSEESNPDRIQLAESLFVQIFETNAVLFEDSQTVTRISQFGEKLERLHKKIMHMIKTKQEIAESVLELERDLESTCDKKRLLVLHCIHNACEGSFIHLYCTEKIVCKLIEMISAKNEDLSNGAMIILKKILSKINFDNNIYNVKIDFPNLIMELTRCLLQESPSKFAEPTLVQALSDAPSEIQNPKTTAMLKILNDKGKLSTLPKYDKIFEKVQELIDYEERVVNASDMPAIVKAILATYKRDEQLIHLYSPKIFKSLRNCAKRHLGGASEQAIEILGRMLLHAIKNNYSHVKIDVPSLIMELLLYIQNPENRGYTRSAIEIIIRLSHNEDYSYLLKEPEKQQILVQILKDDSSNTLYQGLHSSIKFLMQ